MHIANAFINLNKEQRSSYSSNPMMLTAAEVDTMIYIKATNFSISAMSVKVKL